MKKNKLIGNIFSFKSNNCIWFLKNKNRYYFENGDKIFILNENENARHLYKFIAFHFKKGFIYFPFVKNRFLYHFKKIEI